MTQGNSLVVLAAHIFDSQGLREFCGVPATVLRNYFAAVQDGYLDVPYHNHVHGTDVMQAMFWFN